MDSHSKRILFILLFSSLVTACSIDMIAGPEEEPNHANNAVLSIVPAFRSYVAKSTNSRLSKQFISSNRSALQRLETNIQLLNFKSPSIRHTLVTENNQISTHYSDYVQHWKIPLELYSNSHYLRGINYRGPDSNVLVDVAITKSGELHAYKIIVSTGTPELDTLIKDIIHHNEPFEPLSSEIQKHTDILHITQMWQFRN